MNLVNYISSAIIPTIILLIILYGIMEKRKVYDVFVEGAKEGMQMTYKIFPTLIGVFVAIGVLRSSGVVDLIVKFISPITNILKIPPEIMPLALIRPISGSASMAVATDIMTTYGVDSTIGLIASTIMGSTETTLYTIAIYTSCVGIKRIRFVLTAALIADIVGMAVSVVIWRFLS